MIKNERQYRITRAQLERFRAEIERMARGTSAPPGTHPELVKAQLDAMRSQGDDLQREIDEYEALQAGTEKVLTVTSFAELPDALVKARIAGGLSQKQLADRIGVKEQQVQRYEATGYAGASLTRIQEVIAALGVHVTEDVYLPSARLAVAGVLARLKSAGIHRDFASNRLLPPVSAEGDAPESATISALGAADVVSRVFGWSARMLFGDAPLTFSGAAAGTARFKLRKGQEARGLYAYAAYAQYLARLAIRACPTPPARTLQTDPAAVGRSLARSGAEITLRQTTSWLWDRGIPVLPLADSGMFHGACWRIGGRGVVVIKQRTESEARWIYDLLHEYWHLATERSETDFSHVDWETALESRESLAEEARANMFAGDVVLDGRAEPLADECVKAASGSVEKLKTVVPSVARNAGVRVDSLANYLAFRLSLQGIAWWGAAANLQKRDEAPFATVRTPTLSA
jgi:transcriptional regulator with XRE-family HTH domain